MAKNWQKNRCLECVLDKETDRELREATTALHPQRASSQEEPMTDSGEQGSEIIAFK